jgi:hypothetical protein
VKELFAGFNPATCNSVYPYQSAPTRIETRKKSGLVVSLNQDGLNMAEISNIPTANESQKSDEWSRTQYGI